MNCRGFPLDCPKSIGANIQKKREEKGWKREELAQRTGLSSVYIGMIERGEKVPKLETFVRIINVLDTSSDLILADVVDRAYISKASHYLDILDAMPTKERKKILKIIKVFVGTTAER